ncbi:MAG: hypothetical protein ACKOW6_00175 [Fluviibacter sp.]
MGCETSSSASKTIADKSTSANKLDFLKAMLQKTNPDESAV